MPYPTMMGLSLINRFDLLLWVYICIIVMLYYILLLSLVYYYMGFIGIVI